MDKEKIIVLIGIGNIGYRHFQSLLDINIKSHLIIIDAKKDSLTKAKTYADNLEDKKIRLTYKKNADMLPEKIDVLIIATSSLVRYKIFKEITGKSQIKYVIFEKFLFPSEADYYEVRERLTSNHIKAYVNTPCRLYPGYIKLKEQLREEKHIDVLVSGSNWGLACNIIHTIDVIGFLMDSYASLISDGASLDDIILQSKRKDYIEFTGRMICTLGDVAHIILDSYSTGESIYKTTIYTKNIIFTISETEQMIKISRDGRTRMEEFPIYYQSQLTAKIVEELINNGKCGLTLYEDTMMWHISLLKEFTKKYAQIKGQAQTLCPIT